MKIENVIIIGSGPAGLTAAIYAARANLCPLVICGDEPGGQLTITTDVENYPGTGFIQGPKLIEQMTQQAESVGTRFIHESVDQVDLTTTPFKITIENEIKYSKSIIIATGARAKWLGLNSESLFRGRGVSCCATCDGFFYKEKTVAVVGGGNTAVEEALYLTKHASKVFLIHRRDTLRAEKILQDRLFSNEKIEIIWNVNVKEILGNNKVVGILLDKEQVINCDGVFIAIGHSPNTLLFEKYLNLRHDGSIITNNTKTNIPGVFAAGDCQDNVYRQAITAAGNGCIAAIEMMNYLDSL